MVRHLLPHRRSYARRPTSRLHRLVSLRDNRPLDLAHHTTVLQSISRPCSHNHATRDDKKLSVGWITISRSYCVRPPSLFMPAPTRMIEISFWRRVQTVAALQIVWC